MFAECLVQGFDNLQQYDISYKYYMYRITRRDVKKRAAKDG